MSKQGHYGSKKFSATETFKLVASALSFVVDLVTAAIFVLGSPGSFRVYPPEASSFHLALIIVLFALVMFGLTLLITALTQRYKRLNEDEWKWKYEVERSRATHLKREIRLRRSREEAEEVIYQEIEKFGRVAGWIGFLPHVAWSVFTGSIMLAFLLPILVELRGALILWETRDFIIIYLLFYGIPLMFYTIALDIAKSIVRNSFRAL